MKEQKLTKKAYLVIMIVCVCVVGILLVAIAGNNAIIRKVNLADYEKTESVVFSLGDVNNSGSMLQITNAWIEQKSTDVFNVHIALYCENTGELYQLPSQYVELSQADDTATEISEQQDTNIRRGVYAWGILRLMKYRPDYKYDIFFLIDNNGQKKYIDTGVTLG